MPASWILVLSEHLPNETFGSIPLHGSPQLLGCGDPEPRLIGLLGQQKYRHQPAMGANTAVVDLLEFLSPFQAAVCAEAAIHGRPDTDGLTLRPTAGQREDTVSRFRPFERRRLTTRRPFLVLMRTRNPWVRRRRRLFG
jgi:hypothetical protein